MIFFVINAIVCSQSHLPVSVSSLYMVVSGTSEYLQSRVCQILRLTGLTLAYTCSTLGATVDCVHHVHI